MPKLSSDRLGYTLLDGIGAIIEVWSLEEIKEIYANIEIQQNEEGIEELGFKDKEIAEKFVCGMSQVTRVYIENKTLFSMQFLADIMKKMNEKNLISKQDLYNLSEKEVIERIEKCDISNIAKNFKIWRNATKIKESDTLIRNRYCVSIPNPKIRYINPLVRQGNEFVRIAKISAEANNAIEKIRNFKNKKYAYLDFDFNRE